MNDTNIVTLAGRLTRDPEMRYTPKGTAVANIGMATTRKWETKDGGGGEATTFVDLTAFGAMAEKVQQHFRKGSAAVIVGSLRTESWEGKDGQKRSKLTVVVDAITSPFAGGPKLPESKPAPARSVEPDEPDLPAGDSDDVPF